MYKDKESYKKYTESRAKRSPVGKNCLAAFSVGGLICATGEILYQLFGIWGADSETASLLVTATLIFTSALLTGLGIFDNIARFAGAGTLVPVTGFANSVVSPAIDTKSEGLILGVGAKIFTVAGPVLLYAILSGSVYGVVYWVTTLL